MADLPTFTVTGQPLPPGDPFTLDLLPFFATDNSVAQYREWTPEELGTQQTFAPPAPVEVPVLPEVVVTPSTTVLSTLLRGLVWFFTPQPTGPRAHDELDDTDVVFNPPPPRSPPPGGTDPIMPPNWNDLVQWPGTPTYVPITPINLGPVEMPTGEPEFVVSPPRVTPRNDVFPISWPIEVPFGFPDIGIDLGPGPTPAPTGTPGSDPAPFELRPDLDPRRTAQPDMPGTIAPDLFSPPLPDIIGNPFGDPVATPGVPERPGTDTRGPTVPDFLSPIFTPNIVPDPTLTEFEPRNPVTSDVCQCGKKEKKKKKKKKDREVCYRGTYIESKRGLSKKKVEQVPCEDRARRSARAPAKKKLKPGQFPGLGLLGSEHLTGSDIADLATSAVKEFAPVLLDYFKPKKAKKPKKLKKGRKPKTRAPRLPGTFNTTPFPFEP